MSANILGNYYLLLVIKFPPFQGATILNIVSSIYHLNEIFSGAVFSLISCNFLQAALAVWITVLRFMGDLPDPKLITSQPDIKVI